MIPILVAFLSLHPQVFQPTLLQNKYTHTYAGRLSCLIHLNTSNFASNNKHYKLELVCFLRPASSLTTPAKPLTTPTQTSKMRPAQILALAGVATAQVVTSASNGTVATMTTPQSTVNTQAPNWGNTTASASATWSPVTSEFPQYRLFLPKLTGHQPSLPQHSSSVPLGRRLQCPRFPRPVPLLNAWRALLLASSDLSLRDSWCCKGGDGLGMK